MIYLYINNLLIAEIITLMCADNFIYLKIIHYITYIKIDISIKPKE